MVDFYTAEQLAAMGIFQLRDLARKLGHHSPTDKRKQELIDFILAAKEIPVESEAPQKKRRGRPPKAIMDVNVSELVKSENKEVKPTEKAEKNDKKGGGKGDGAEGLPYDAASTRRMLRGTTISNSRLVKNFLISSAICLEMSERLSYIVSTTPSTSSAGLRCCLTSEMEFMSWLNPSRA